MAINHSMKKILKALSFDGIEVEAARHLASLKAIDPMKIFHKTIDYKIYNGDYEVPGAYLSPRGKGDGRSSRSFCSPRWRLGNGLY